MFKKGIRASIDPSVRKYIVDSGFDEEYGARPIKRLIQKAILDKLADNIIRGQVKDGSKVKISFKESALTISS